MKRSPNLDKPRDDVGLLRHIISCLKSRLRRKIRRVSRTAEQRSSRKRSSGNGGQIEMKAARRVMFHIEPSKPPMTTLFTGRAMNTLVFHLMQRSTNTFHGSGLSSTFRLCHVLRVHSTTSVFLPQHTWMEGSHWFKCVCRRALSSVIFPKPGFSRQAYNAPRKQHKEWEGMLGRAPLLGRMRRQEKKGWHYGRRRDAARLGGWHTRRDKRNLISAHVTRTFGLSMTVSRAVGGFSLNRTHT